MDAFECNGFWWLASAPDKKVAGVLRFSDEQGLVLSLLEVLGDLPPNSGEKRLPLILGFSHDSKLGAAVSLRNCVRKSYSLGLGAYAHESYYASFGLFGFHGETDEDPAFPSCQLRFSGLQQWAWTGMTVTKDVEEEPSFSVGIQARAKDPYVVDLPDCRFSLGWDFSVSEGMFRLSLEESAVIRLTSRTARTTGEWLRRFVSPIHDFLTFATDTPTRLDQITFGHPSRPTQTVAFVYQRFFSKAPNEADFSRHRQMFLFAEVRDRFGDLLQAWMNAQSKFRAACGVFFGTLYAHQSYLESRFLPVMQAISLYHRAKEGIDRRERLERALPPSLLESTPEADRESLLTWLTERHVDTFYETLLALLTNHEAELEPLLPLGTDAFLSETINLRSYALHREGNAAEQDGYSGRMFFTLSVLSFLFKACLLKEVGFTDEERRALFNRNPTFGFLQELARKTYPRPE